MNREWYSMNEWAKYVGNVYCWGDIFKLEHIVYSIILWRLILEIV